MDEVIGCERRRAKENEYELTYPPLATAIRCSGPRQITSYPDNLRHIDTQESTSGTANLNLSTTQSLSG